MFWTIELLYFVVMIAVFVVLMLVAKLPSGLSLMASALVGVLLSWAFSGTEFEFRYLLEGAFGYFDTILTITTAMVFMGALQVTGALEYISAAVVKALRRWPTILLIVFMFIIMFPAMVTGSSLASAITSGALVAPIMVKWGIPRAKVGAIVALGSVLGMIAPPVNVPAMVICDVVDIAFTGFELPLLLMVVPVAIAGVLVLGRKYVKPIYEDEVANVCNVEVLKELKGTVVIPLYLLILLIVGEMVFPKIFGSFAMPGMFVVSTVVAFFFGRKLPFFKKHANDDQEDKDECIVDVLRHGVGRSLGAMGLLMGVGMFMESIALNGVRSYFVANALMLPSLAKYFSMALTLPILGGISAYGSASILGGPFVMALYGSYASIPVTCGLSMLSAIGEFLPPTAMSATFAASMVEEKKWTKVTKAALPALGICYAYGLIYILVFSKAVFKEDLFGIAAKNGTKFSQDKIYLILFIIMMVLTIVFAVVISLVYKNRQGKKNNDENMNNVENMENMEVTE